MDTGISWEPKTLKKALDNGEQLNLTEINGRYVCECGSPANASSIIDLRLITQVDKDWACDGCHSTWRRNLENIVGVREYDKSADKRKLEDRKWLRDWVATLGAPVQMLVEIDAAIAALELT